MSGSIQIPDFAGTIQRGQQLQQQQQLSRLQMLSAQQALDDAERYRTISGPILPQLATAEGPQRLNLLGKLAEAGPQGVALALPEIQRERELAGSNRELSMYLGGGAGPAAPGAAPAAPGGDFFTTLAGAESGGNPNARNPRSTATGPFQFIDGTWRAFVAANPEVFAGMTPEQQMAARTDPRIARLGAEWYTRENAAALQQAGLPPTQPNLGLAHFFGAGDAAKLLRSDPATPIETVLSPQVIAANPQLRGQTVGAVIGQAGQRYGGGAAPPAAPGGGQQPPRTAGLPSDQVLMQMLQSRHPRVVEAAKNMMQLRAQANRGDQQNPFANNGDIHLITTLGPLVANGTATPEQHNLYSGAVTHWQVGGPATTEPDPNNPGMLRQVIIPRPLPAGYPPPRPLGAGAPAAPGAAPGAAPAVDPNAPRPTGVNNPVNPPSPADRSRLRQIETEIEGVQNALQTFRTARRNASAGDRLTAASGTPNSLSTAWNNVALLAKGEALYNLGVLNDGDLAILRRTLSDPSTIAGLFTTNAASENQIKMLEEILVQRLAAARRQYGGQPAPAAPAAPAAGATVPPPPAGFELR